MVSKKEIFEIPLSRIANSNIAGKTEVSLEFTPQPLPPGTKKSRAVDELVEMRLYVPGSRVKGSDDEQSDAGDDETSAAQAFHDLIKEKAEIGQVTGEGIVTFSDILVQTPRSVLPNARKPPARVLLTGLCSEDVTTLICSHLSSGFVAKLMTTKSCIPLSPAFSFCQNLTRSMFSWS